MRIAKIELQNWMRFFGVHELELEAKSYAVVARAADNPERSNWLGKSSLLEAIDFALFGRHRFRTEDEVISAGEAVSEIKLTLDTGTQIIRRRERGKRTSLYVFGREAREGARNDDAQAIVHNVVGLSAEDFLATCYFQQRQMARLILADPSSRMETVSGWLRLGPLERCEDKVRAEVSALAEQLRTVEASLSSFDEMERHALDGQSESQIRDWLAGCSEVLDKRREQLRIAREALTENGYRASARDKVADFEALVASGKALRAELEGENGTALKAAYEKTLQAEREAALAVRIASTAKAERGALAKGEFEGTCPVAGISCPAKDDINRDRKRSLKLYQEASAKAEEVEAAYAEAKAKEVNARARFQEFERKESRLQSMREQAARMEAEYERARKIDPPGETDLLRSRMEEAARRLDETMAQEKTTRARLDTIEGIQRRRESLSRSAEELRARLATYREAAVIFGKQGAQRRLAEGALGEIEEGANGMLRDAGMDLSVSVRWAREGSGLARACDACGNPFPASAKAKVCTRCQAARGPNLINKLDFVLSDRSGAAEDLAGAALQLSASAWLRAEKGSLWETAIIDEAFGQLDGANRRALGRHLAALLAGRYGFSQALVVAHSSDVLEALPGRIEIEGGPRGSSVRVVG